MQAEWQAGCVHASNRTFPRCRQYEALNIKTHGDALGSSVEDANGTVAHDDSIPHDALVRHGAHVTPSGLSTASQLQPGESTEWGTLPFNQIVFVLTPRLR